MITTVQEEQQSLEVKIEMAVARIGLKKQETPTSDGDARGDKRYNK